jgi:hypothetical protein
MNLDPFVIPSILICMMNTAISKLLSEEHVIESSAFHGASWESGFLEIGVRVKNPRKAMVDGPCASPFAHCVKLRLDYHISAVFTLIII